MPMHTNVSRHIIHVSEGCVMVPGQPIDVPAKATGGWLFKEYVKAGDIKPGEVEVKPEIEQDEPPELIETSTAKPQTTQAKTGNQKT